MIVVIKQVPVKGFISTPIVFLTKDILFGVSSTKQSVDESSNCEKGMKMSEESSTDGLVEVLSLLDLYQNEHEEASGHFKKALWNLTKARHSKKSFMSVDSILVADDVREEVRPRVVLNAASEKDSCCSFTTTDPIHLIESMKENQSNPQSRNAVDEGLRQRKNNNETKSTVWTVEQHEYYDEEARLSRIDPLDLFGGSLNPRELKIAQENARKSLEAYVKAANLKIDIDRRLKQLTAKS
ncbi:hypothetical protein FisN_17Hh024 [Fistulifera solaris]|uniref:Vacuolar ATPase assembly protein VMA22 n=1 Tax=Fistulifera solaris TaxID=1519565 RepID=A0A1Z5JGG4_FISSO|nr:hypothetical protein FisN_17Hh024 [Fistulifera solaris]|eukprot:GAX13095.1 hypothetical protein FisN_17Hh024 [Fistulifera solaris]